MRYAVDPGGIVVVKVGSSLLVDQKTGALHRDWLKTLASDLKMLAGAGADILVVSSGAIASGRHQLGLTKKVKGVPFKQVLASVGQHRLMGLYEQLFRKYNITVAQALLAKVDLLDRAGYLNARNTLLALLELGVICIVNENDVVAVD